MPGNTFGVAFRVTTAGESHGSMYVAIVDGCPAGMALGEADFEHDMARRRPGQSRLTTQRGEPDRVQLVSGVYAGHTTGAPIALLIANRDARPEDYDANVLRPGHADATYQAKYAIRDPRGGGRASARETVLRVAAAVIAKKILAHMHGITIRGAVEAIGHVRATFDEEAFDPAAVEAHPTRCPDPVAAAAMAEVIDEARAAGDSVGGVALIVASGVPPGLGEPVFDKLKADLAKALLSIPAVTGFEFGSGFAGTGAPGSRHNDAMLAIGAAGLTTRTNRHGGMLGGISTGMPILLRCALKPTSTIRIAQEGLTDDGRPVSVQSRGRHDPCVVPRFIPVGEAMVALALADHALRARLARLDP